MPVHGAPGNGRGREGYDWAVYIVTLLAAVLALIEETSFAIGVASGALLITSLHGLASR